MSVCAYCGQRAVNRDHVVPKAIAKKHPDLPTHLRATVWACFACNHHKKTRKLIPPSWGHRIPELQSYIPGRWRVWNGDLRAKAYRETWK